jgi:ribosomal protein RSM22 (predicted rRNA methylase)
MEDVQLPAQVKRGIEERADAVGIVAVKHAAEALSAAYREGRTTRLRTDADVAAYLVTRMPATYAAARGVLDELPELPVRSVLDVGAGSGAATLAARERFAAAARFTLMERDPSLAEAAREFIPEALVIAGDVAAARELPQHDLVIAAYSLGEIGWETVDRLWAAARVALVVIEPGTPRGSREIEKIRERLLEVGAHMAAPCPAAMECPLGDADWCHFAARVERSSLHRKVKGGELGYEDEKYSYVAVTREPVELSGARVVRHPLHRPGLIELELCTAAGLRRERVTKRDKDQFRAARRAEWGGRYSEGAK